VGFDIEAELNCHVNSKGYDIVEIPIKYRSRLGKKKLGFRHGLEIFKRIIME
jgi:dolichol-phosphate mannosyltransferase